jgi:hypothetical protein
MAVVQPFLIKHGFSVSFTSRIVDDKRMAVICTLTHIGGHSENNEFAVRMSSGPPGCSDAQADGSNHSYARRYALCDALNITIDKDSDARMEGAIIDGETARQLQEEARAAGIVGEEKVAIFLALAGADSFAEIREGRVAMLREVLADRIKGGDATKRISLLYATWCKKADKKPAEAKAAFHAWAESVLQRTVAASKDMTPSDCDRLEAWFGEKGVLAWTEARGEPGEGETGY